MKDLLGKPIYLVLLFALFNNSNYAQENTTKSDSSSTDLIKAFYPIIEARLAQPGGDTARYFILQKVQNHCDKEYKCLMDSYKTILKKLLYNRKYYTSLLLSEEMIQLAHQKKDLNAEAEAHENLARASYALGDNKTDGENRTKALALYEQAGNLKKSIQIKAYHIEGRAWYLGEATEVLPEIEELLGQATELGYDKVANTIRIRLKYITETFGLHEKLIENIEALENIQLSNPLQASEYEVAFHAASGRADLYLKESNYNQARKYYQKALRVFKNTDQHSWLEIYALHRLAKLEWQVENIDSAKKYLDEAYTIAKALDNSRGMIETLELKVAMAEAVQNFADAFHFTKEIKQLRIKKDSLNDTFDVQKDVLRLERDKLENEKVQRKLELQLKNNQLVSSILITVLISLLTIGITFGWYRQRKQKNELVVQNAVIKKQTNQLQQLDATKARFFANISHELRTPLTLMLGPIKSLMKKSTLPKNQIELLELANKSGQQLKQLINEILDLQKLEAGKLELKPEATELNTFFLSYLTQFESLASYKSIDFSFLIEVGKKKVVMLDREKYRQILYNLLSNAFNYTPQGGKIFTKITVDQGFLKLEVTDNGHGIHPDDIPQLFDRYFQTNRPDQPITGGTGIGLAICREFTQLMDGKIQVESKPKAGARFMVVIPISAPIITAKLPTTDNKTIKNSIAIKQQKSLSPSISLVPNQQTALKPQLLVVDDNLDLQKYLRLVLSDKYQVTTASNGEEALQLLAKTSKFQLIISDLMMPIMDGYQLLKKLKSSDTTRYIPVIMLTARAAEQDKLKALRIGVDDYILKPFHEEELETRIENLLRHQAIRMKVAATETLSSKSAFTIPEVDQKWLEDFEEYLRKNINSDLLSVPFLATEFAMSESTLLRQLKRLTGLSPLQYLQEMRLNEARKLLENGIYNSITQVAHAVGYSETRSFSRSFKNRFGKSPSSINN